MAFELPDLPYAHDALASKGMSAETLEYHHDIHHKAYVDNANKLLIASEYEGMSLEDAITSTYQSGAVAQSGLFNNLSQLWNHNQFWEMMTPDTKAMPSELELALAESFGSVQKFKDEFAAAGQRAPGACWAAGNPRRRYRGGTDGRRPGGAGIRPGRRRRSHARSAVAGLLRRCHTRHRL